MADVMDHARAEAEREVLRLLRCIEGESWRSQEHVGQLPMETLMRLRVSLSDIEASMAALEGLTLLGASDDHHAR
jgi:hypothetical protein